MRITKLLAAVGLAALLAACATTDDGAQSQNDMVAENANVEPGSPDEMICRNERVTGQMIPRRVCMTRAERQALEDRADETFRDESARNLRINPSGGQ